MSGVQIASSGNIRVSRGYGEHTYINARNLQENAELAGTEFNRPLANTSTEDLEIEINLRRRQDETEEAKTFNLKDSSKKKIVSSGKSRRRGEHTYINDAHLQENAELAETESKRPSTSTEDVDIEVTLRKKKDEPEESTTFNLEDSSKHFFSPKCIILCVVVALVIAGIVALTIVLLNYKHKKEDGGYAITTVECPTKSFRLGDQLNFTCSFDTSHVKRKDLLTAEVVHVRPKDRAFVGISHDYRVSATTGGNLRTFYFYGINLTAKCSSAGTYDVIFLNVNGNEIHSAIVTYSIEASFIVTTFNQRQLKGNDCLKSEFDATCELQNDCNSYHVTMYRLKAGLEGNLNKYMTCDRSYTDVGGHLIKCKATIPDNLVENFVDLGCKMSTTLQDNRPFVQREAFSLPKCGIEPSCTTYIPPNPRPFNCSERSRDVMRLNEALCGFPVVTSCFKAGRKIFTGIFKDISNNLTCSSYQAVPVCRLSWCRDYNYIIKNEVPGTAICPSSYEERYLTPPEDFLTTPYTTPYRVTV